MKDGGPAFPSKKRVVRAGYATEEFEPVNGMTMRDYFAAKAMQGLFAGLDRDAERFMAREAEPAAAMAKACYTMADAMIQERSNT